MDALPAINPAAEKKRIVDFLKQTFKKQGINKAVIGLSGGIDSAATYQLLKDVLPEKNITTVHLPYFDTTETAGKVISIKKTVDALENLLAPMNEIRSGNIMARVRMIILFDLAKKNNALVVGTENRTEHLLGYFTRFGDAASDIEPIQHLYKTQINQLAKYLGVPEKIIKQPPSANLWPGQTDEGEFGFTYKEADNVLYLYFDQKKSLPEIKKSGFKNAERIIDFALKNHFKLQTPYHV